MKDDVRLFRVREDAVKDEFKNKRDKPLTEEEAEQMWKNVSLCQLLLGTPYLTLISSGLSTEKRA